LGIGAGAGLADVLIEDDVLDRAIQHWLPVDQTGNGVLSVSVLAAGTPPPNPAELLESEAMADLIRRARAEYDLVLIDTPPLTAVADAIPLFAHVDGVAIVSRLGRNTRTVAARLREELVALNAPLLGVIANGVQRRAASKYGYAGYADYSYGPERTAR
jgi:Mrp family chromosome partitioning ATPase